MHTLARDLARTLARPGPFARGRARSAALAGYDSVRAVLDRLADRARPDPAEADALTLALLERHRSGEDAAYWAAALTLAYLPMLRRLRAGLRPRRGHDPDRDQLVLECFLRACAGVPLARRGRAPALLKTLTARAVYAALGRERRALELELAEPGALEQAAGAPWPGAPASSRSRQRFLLDLRASGAELSALLLEHAGRRVEPGRLRVVGETVLAGRPVRAWVRQAHPALGREAHERLYLRTAKQVSRTLALLRLALAPLRRELAA